MNHITPSALFPVVMRPGNKIGFTGHVDPDAVLELDVEYSKKEYEDDKAEVSAIETFFVLEEISFGTGLETIERMGYEPASMTQLALSGLVDEANNIGQRLRALRHTVLINMKEYSLSFDPSLVSDPNDGYCLENVDETVPLEEGSAIGIIRRKPINAMAAA